MRHYIRKNKLLLFWEIIAATGHAVSDALLAFSMGNMTNAAVDGQLHSLLLSSAACVVCLIGIYLFYVLEMHLRKKISGKCICAIKEDIYDAMAKRGISLLHEKTDSYYLNLLRGDMEILERDYFDSLWRGINLTIQTVFCVVALFFVSAKLVLIFSLLCILPQLTSRLFQKPLSIRKNDFSSQNTRCIQAGKEYIEGFDTLLLFSHYKTFIARLLREDNALEDRRREKDVCQIKVSYGVTTINMISQILCMAAAAYFVAIGELRFGALTASTQLPNYTFTPLNTVINCVLSALSTRDIRSKVVQLVSEPISSGEKAFVSGDIIFSNVSAGYGEKVVVHNFSYALPLGGKYAIIGGSGAGKSTIIKALVGSAKVSEGQITVGGIDVTDISPSELHKNILYVPQTPYLFEGTVLENISFFGDEASARVAALRAALSAELLNAQAGGDRGNMLSGGEMTRLSVARALCSEASIIIFDEPTSGLDPETAEDIENLLLSISNKTIIVITHNWDARYLQKFDDVITIGEAIE